MVDNEQAKIPYFRMHPVILHAKHLITRLIIMSEHKRSPSWRTPHLLCHLYHANFIFLALDKPSETLFVNVQSVAVGLSNPILHYWDSFLLERSTPGPIFDSCRLDYAGPLHIKYGHVRQTNNSEGTCVCVCILNFEVWSPGANH